MVAMAYCCSNLRIYGKSPKSKTLPVPNVRKQVKQAQYVLYEDACYLYKAQMNRDQPQKSSAYSSFEREVATALDQIRRHHAGAELLQKLSNIDFKVDIIRLDAVGTFWPRSQFLMGKELMPGDRIHEFTNVKGLIQWGPTTSFRHDHTAGDQETTYPPYIILAHEIGHVIQLSEHLQQGGDVSGWHENYKANQETVEMDNIRRHETPIVLQARLLERTYYNTRPAPDANPG